MTERKRRANGEASRSKILDAAAEIAGERGYEGTSINLVSERSGLPASSIYWHFGDKDQLISAVVDRSFRDWVDAITTPPDLPEDLTIEERFRATLRASGAALTRHPDFLRLGLLLLLEQRPEEPAARLRFLAARDEVMARITFFYGAVFEGLDAHQIQQLAVLTLATSDGLFVAADHSDVDLADHFEVLATGILGAAQAMGWAVPLRSVDRS